MTTNDFKNIAKKAEKLCKQKLPATIYKDEVTIGRVWKMDNSTGWNYLIESE